MKVLIVGLLIKAEGADMVDEVTKGSGQVFTQLFCCGG
jgi:hypothetical protein